MTSNIVQEDQEVIQLLLGHLFTQLGISLTETDYSRAPRAGEWLHISTAHHGASPGMAHLFFATEAEASAAAHLLHDHHIQIGSDMVHIQATTDETLSHSLQGNGRRV